MKPKTPILALAALLLAGALAAAEAVPAAEAAPASPWKGELISSASANQAHFDNWSAGGEDSVAWAVALNGAFKRDDAHRLWENKLRLDYGQARQGDEEPRKTADAIHAESSYTQKLNQWVNPYASVAWDTQFVNGYRYFSGTTLTPVAISKFMDPGYLTESLGLGAAWKEVLKVKAGAGAKQTFTDAYPGYADDPGTAAVERFKNEAGATGQVVLKVPLGKEAVFSSQLDLFSNLAAADQVDLKWANLLSAKINGWLSANLSLDITYDRDVSTQRQLKQGLSLSASYNLL